MSLQRVCVFCGSSSGRSPVYAEAAAELGRLLVERGLGLVYGGGDVGLMGIVADAVLAAGGEVVGVMPKALVDKEISHAGLTELHVVGSMHERKALMADLADAFIALPGGFGTYEEMLEILTWGQLGMHAKPAVLLDVDGFYDGIFTQVARAVADGFIRPEHAPLAQRAATPAAALDALASAPPPPLPKWIDRDER